MSSLVSAQDETHLTYVTNEWDGFVSTLSSGFITITKSLTSTVTAIDLHPCDEWLAWFTAALSLL